MRGGEATTSALHNSGRGYQWAQHQLTCRDRGGAYLTTSRGISVSVVELRILNLPSGETADFEFTPGAAGDFVLEIGRPNAPPEGHAVLRESPPAR